MPRTPLLIALHTGPATVVPHAYAHAIYCNTRPPTLPHLTEVFIVPQRDLHLPLPDIAPYMRYPLIGVIAVAAPARLVGRGGGYCRFAFRT